LTRGKIRKKVGMVKSNSMDKTVVVEIANTVKHSQYTKPIKRNSKFKAHDKNNSCQIGDKVEIVESKPISKTKRWRVSKIIEHSGMVNIDIEDEDIVSSDGDSK